MIATQHWYRWPKYDMDSGRFTKWHLAQVNTQGPSMRSVCGYTIFGGPERYRLEVAPGEELPAATRLCKKCLHMRDDS